MSRILKAYSPFLLSHIQTCFTACFLVHTSVTVLLRVLGNQKTPGRCRKVLKKEELESALGGVLRPDVAF